MENCTNHPQVKAFSVCHGCGKPYCESCLMEGVEYYYCKRPECQLIYKEETKLDLLPSTVDCPACSSELELTDTERASRKIHCPECQAFIDFTVDPPKVEKSESYSLLLTTMNEGDVAIIKSVLDDLEADYYVFDEDFMAVRPLVQPVRIYVAQSEYEKAKEALKDFNFHLFGVSMNRNPQE